MKTARKSRDNAYASIRSKLVAAVAMLLVASFMVVSSSYAWFTLSTAPEVTGINTTVGANGNLEIALYKGEEPTTNVGDSGDFYTWGNLVALGDKASELGLNLISLMPAAFAVEGNKVGNALLYTPEYGEDGRVTELKGEAALGSYDGANFRTGNALTGIYAIGTASGMTPQQADHRAAKGKVSSAQAAVVENLKTALNKIGGQLGTAAIGQAMGDGDDAKYDISNVDVMLTHLDAAQAELGVMLVNYAKAIVAHKLSSLSEDEYNLAVKAINFTVAGLSETISVGDLSGTLLSMDADLQEAYNFYNSNATAIAGVKEARAGVQNLNEVPYGTVQTILNPLVNLGKNDETGEVYATFSTPNLEEVPINGDLKNEFNTIFMDVMKGNAVITLKSGSGVFANYAEVVADYQTKINANVTHSALGDEAIAIEITMKTNVAPDCVLATNATYIVASPAAPSTSTPGDDEQTGAEGSTGTGGSFTLSDYYGYAIDLALRTNAAASNLLLQVDEANRIYSDGGLETTQGAGSKMTFKATVNSYTTEQMKDLMRAIRVVFADSTQTIVGVAVLDVDHATDNGEEVSARLALAQWEAKEIVISKSVSDTGNVTTTEANVIQLRSTKTGDGESATYTYVDHVDDPVLLEEADAKGNYELMSLPQNIPTVIRAYVYLDGQLVDNSMVANAESSMSGTLNLQFSSSADLVPMDYAGLQDASMSESTTPVTTTVDSDLSNKPSTAKSGDKIILPGSVNVAGTDDDGAPTTTATPVVWTLDTTTAATLDGNTVTIGSVTSDTSITIKAMSGADADATVVTSFTVSVKAPEATSSTSASETETPAESSTSEDAGA